MAVLEAAAVGVPDEVYGQDVQACVCLREGVDADERELIEHCQRQLGSFKSPTRIHFLSELPKGPSGKIQRLKLPDIIATGDARGVHHDE
jgi:long-chain acyl-CoA synthetase